MIPGQLVKPQPWAIDPTATDPQWERFWSQCVICVPAWENAKGAAPMIIPGRGSPTQNLPTALFCTKIGNATWSSPPGVYGPGLFNASTSTDDWQIPPPNGASDIVPTARATYLMVRQPFDTTISGTRSFGRDTTVGGATTAAGGHVPFSDGKVYWDFGQQAGSNRIIWTGYTPTTLFETWAFVAGSQGSFMYFNGIAVQNNGGVALTRGNTGTGNVGILTGNGQTTSNSTNMLFFALLDDEWTAGMVAEWNSDPFGMLRLNQPAVTGGGAAAPGTGDPNLPLLGIGGTLRAMVGWRAARAIIDNKPRSRRGLILPWG